MKPFQQYFSMIHLFFNVLRKWNLGFFLNWYFWELKGQVIIMCGIVKWSKFLQKIKKTGFQNSDQTTIISVLCFYCVAVFQLAQWQMKPKKLRMIPSLSLMRLPRGGQADHLHPARHNLWLHCLLHHLGNNNNCRQVRYWCLLFDLLHPSATCKLLHVYIYKDMVFKQLSLG